MLTQESFNTSCEALSMQKDLTYLVALSGGIDSMVLLHLLIRSGYKVRAAHVNYGLRGEDSNEDERFCSKVCNELKIPIDLYRTSAEDLKGSIQTEARKLRLLWFKKLCAHHRLAAIITGHHLDDQWETVLLNMSRGTGIRGMKGMPRKSKWVIRPLIDFSRKAIGCYAQEHNIEWREDVSNETNNYRRNILRNEVIPLFKSWNPKWEEGMRRFFGRMELAGQLSETLLERMRSELLHEDDLSGVIRISLLELYGRGVTGMLLDELLRPYGFNYAQIDQFWKEGAVSAGAVIHSNTHSLRREKSFLYLTDQTLLIQPFGVLPQTVSMQQRRGSFWELHHESSIPGTEIEANSACLKLSLSDFEVQFEWRLPIAGEKINVKGIQGRKKISDILQESGIPLAYRKHWPVLARGAEIMWIPGVRMAEKWDNRQDLKSEWRLFFKKPT
jgi:tRNA(Ile)-lysidine synthase